MFVKPDMKSKQIIKNTLAIILCIFTLAIFAGCACPRMATHYNTSVDGSRDPWHQCTLEAIQCAWKPTEKNISPLTAPVWLAARGLYRITVPVDQRNESY